MSRNRMPELTFSEIMEAVRTCCRLLGRDETEPGWVVFARMCERGDTGALYCLDHDCIRGLLALVRQGDREALEGLMTLCRRSRPFLYELRPLLDRELADLPGNR